MANIWQFQSLRYLCSIGKKIKGSVLLSTKIYLALVFYCIWKNLVSYIGFELLFGSGPFPSEGIMLQFKRKSEKKSEKEGQCNIAYSFCTIKQ